MRGNVPSGVLQPVVYVVERETGWRHALLGKQGMACVCPHVHATADEAERCREKDGLVPTKVPEGLTLGEVQDFLSIPRTEDELHEGEVQVWMVDPPVAAPPRSRRRRRDGGRRDGKKTRGRSPRPA